MKNSRTQGSAAIVTIIILLIAIAGALGFVFWDKFKSGTPATAELAELKAAPTSQGSHSAYVLTDAVSDINKTLENGVCKGGATKLKEGDFNTASDSDQFAYQGGKSIINKDLTHAYVQYGCGSQGSIAFVKWDKDAWVLVTESARIYPLCAEIRGHEFPSYVVDKCYEDDGAVEPVVL